MNFLYHKSEFSITKKSIIVHMSFPYKRGWEQTHLCPFFRKLVIYK